MNKVLHANAVLLITFFLGSCFLDYVSIWVPRYPGTTDNWDWMLILLISMIPIITLATNLWFTRQLEMPVYRMALISVVGTITLCVVLVLALLTLGIMFHLLIGGHL